jgi:hypothetical protein
MTAQGHPHVIFQRALERGNLAVAWATAHELERLSLADALALTFLIAEREPERFARVSARWFARYCAEERPELDEAQVVAALLRVMTSRRLVPAVRALEALWRESGRAELARVFERRRTTGEARK